MRWNWTLGCPAQVLAGITALTHRDHADERFLSGHALKARSVSRENRGQAKDVGHVFQRADLRNVMGLCGAGICTTLTAYLTALIDAARFTCGRKRRPNNPTPCRSDGLRSLHSGTERRPEASAAVLWHPQILTTTVWDKCRFRRPAPLPDRAPQAQRSLAAGIENLRSQRFGLDADLRYRYRFGTVLLGAAAPVCTADAGLAPPVHRARPWRSLSQRRLRRRGPVSLARL